MDRRVCARSGRARGLAAALGALGLVGAVGCGRGCQSDAGKVADMGLRPEKASGPLAAPAADCPDGLARCEGGTISVSRLATLPVPCTAPGPACTCPWEALADCPNGCAADGVEVVADRPEAAAQLCAPVPGAPIFATPAVPGSTASSGASLPSAAGASSPSASPEESCDEGDRYRCSGSRVVDCGVRRVVANCIRGCFAEGTSIEDDGVNREAAFAILCSR